MPAGFYNIINPLIIYATETVLKSLFSVRLIISHGFKVAIEQNVYYRYIQDSRVPAMHLAAPARAGQAYNRNRTEMPVSTQTVSGGIISLL